MSIDEESEPEFELLDSRSVVNGAAWLKQQVEQGPLLKGCIIVTIEDDTMGFRCFGHVQRYAVAMAGALLIQDAVSGRYEEQPDGSQARTDEPSS